MSQPWAAEEPGPSWWGRLSGGKRIGLVVGSLLALYAASFLVLPSYGTPSGSNEPTLRRGDHFRVNRWAFVYGSPDDGDLVVYADPDPRARASGAQRVGRVVAVGGETVEARDGHLLRNGTPAAERYLPVDRVTSDFGPVTVPKGSVFIMGDNRPNSQDSRLFGPVKQSLLRGHVLIITRPLGRFGRP